MTPETYALLAAMMFDLEELRRNGADEETIERLENSILAVVLLTGGDPERMPAELARELREREGGTLQ